jgi:hypothetical protein
MLKMLISNNFPERWPELLDGAKALLTSINICEVGVGTVVVLEMVCAFRCAPPFTYFPPVASSFFILCLAVLDSTRTAIS